MALLHQFKVKLAEQVVRLSFAHSVSLADTIKFFEEHALKRFGSEVEQYCPGFSNRLLVYVNKVKLVYVAVDEQVFVFFVHLSQLFVSVLEVFEVFLVLRLGALALVALACTLLL